MHYLDLEEAQKLTFPSAQSFEPTKTTKSPDLKAWQVERDGAPIGYFFVDNVVGKHEYITYSLGISLSGEILRVEILDYRETKGGQIRDQTWREQFVSKTAKDPLEVGVDIKNISGATLSCKHVTEGVRNLVQLFNSELREAS